MPAFITVQQFLQRYDWRWVSQNITDTGVPATEASLTDSITPSVSYLRLTAFIEEASEMVMAAAAVGARYSLSDIETYGGSLLIRITSDLVIGAILKRRVRAGSDNEAFTSAYEEALNYLELLRRGERIFYAVPNVPEAGLPATQNLAPSLTLGQPLITDNVRIFGTVGYDRNYGNRLGGG